MWHWVEAAAAAAAAEAILMSRAVNRCGIKLKSRDFDI
jgi:hypothetical protein